MLSHDQEYLSAMASVALAVLLVIVMCCIRANMPDEAADSAGETQKTVEIAGSRTNVHTAMNGNEAKAPQHR
jgi:ABC-type phosphate transport system substrate-binding protein